MEYSSLDKNFISTDAETGTLWERMSSKVTNRILRKKLSDMAFNDAFDRIRDAARDLLVKEQHEEAIRRIENFREIVERKGGIDEKNSDLYAALIQTLTSIYLSVRRIDDAMRCAAITLNLLSRQTKRRDEPYQILLALTLHDLSLIHNRLQKFRQAEREIEKAMRIFDKLAKSSPGRYASAHLTAQSALTAVIRSRTRQGAMLSEYREATEKYLQMVNEGIEGAASLLVDSLAEEGRTLAKMGKDREAIQYYSRALKYLTKIEPEMSERQLRLSIDLGESLLNTKQTRDKGIHLLNTMLYKAAKLRLESEHRRIAEILANSKSKQLDILGFWYKLFPK